MSYFMTHPGTLHEPACYVSDTPGTCWECGAEFDVEDDPFTTEVIDGKAIILCQDCHLYCVGCHDTDYDGDILTMCMGQPWHEKCLCWALSDGHGWETC